MLAEVLVLSSVCVRCLKLREVVDRSSSVGVLDEEGGMETSLGMTSLTHSLPAAYLATELDSTRLSLFLGRGGNIRLKVV